MDPNFQRLADWCVTPTDRPRLKRVVGAQVNWYIGEGHTEALWSGYLEFSDQRAHNAYQFHGTLGVLPGPHRDPVELVISVAASGADRAWAGITGKGIAQTWREDVPIIVDNVDESVLLAHLDTGDAKLSLFLSPTYNYGG